jgi:hypothetical protein
VGLEGDLFWRGAESMQTSEVSETSEVSSNGGGFSRAVLRFGVERKSTEPSHLRRMVSGQSFAADFAIHDWMSGVCC